MRYQVLKALSPTDPRKLELVNLEALLAVAPVSIECELEIEAVTAVRDLYPDAVAMPIPVKLGGGTMWLMAIVASEADNTYDPNDDIPFVLFVRAVSEFGIDKKRFRDHTIFDRKKWKAPVHHASATTAKAVEVEVRGTDLDAPETTSAIVGRLIDGRLVVTVEINGVAVSLAFKDPAVSLIRVTGTSEHPAKLSADGNSVGASFDPNPYR